MKKFSKDGTTESKGRWSREKARIWYENQPLPVGFNYIPAYAANFIEFWQEESFQSDVIDWELSLAAEAGFNTLRTTLHDLVWKADPASFKERLDRFLSIADKHGLTVMVVFFDDCFYSDFALGRQPDPIPGLHNSRAVQTPGTRVVRDTSLWGELERYVN